jgi:hypothetical protein
VTHVRAAASPELVAGGSTVAACFNWNNSTRWTKAVASGGMRLYAPPQGMKSSSRDTPDARADENVATSASIASPGRGRRKNSDLANRYCGCVDSGCATPSPSGSATPS